MEKTDSGCVKCYGVGVEYHIAKNGQKVCDECGGVVLNIQEAFDHIAELKSELVLYRGEDD